MKYKAQLNGNKMYLHKQKLFPEELKNKSHMRNNFHIPVEDTYIA